MQSVHIVSVLVTQQLVQGLSLSKSLKVLSTALTRHGMCKEAGRSDTAGNPW